MKKSLLIKSLKSNAELSETEAGIVVNLFFDKISEALATGDRVEIRRLFSFHSKRYKSYTARNPKTGEKFKIKPKTLPCFKCGKELRDRVDK